MNGRKPSPTCVSAIATCPRYKMSCGRPGYERLEGGDDWEALVESIRAQAFMLLEEPP